MKKRIFCLLLCLIFVFLCGCEKGQKATVKKDRVLKNRYTEMPYYVLNENATSDEIRAMAVKAMRDELTVPWYIDKSINYRKSHAGGDKIFRLRSVENYGGLPYTNGNTGIFHWLQYYDFNTGKISGFSETDLVVRLGNSCSTSLVWGWGAVCTSFTACGTNELLPRNNVFPVGEYSIDVISFGSKGTDTICLENGEQVMFRSYAQAKPADLLNMTFAVEDYKGCHAMMVVEDAHTEYNADGTIDGQRSYLYIQDQRMGALEHSAPFYVMEETGFMHYAGRTHSKFSFASLYNLGYIPETLAEFTGDKPYEKAHCELQKGDGKAFNSLYDDTVHSNYSIITVTADFKKNGKTVAKDKIITHTGDVKRGRIGDIKMSRLLSSESFSKKLKKGEKYDVEIKCLVATGETLTAFKGEVEY